MLFRTNVIGVVCITVSLVLSGCRSTSCCCPITVTGPIEIDQRGPRGSLDPDVSALPPVDDFENDAPAEYRHLKADECQCLAANNASLASVMKLEQRLCSNRSNAEEDSFTRRLTCMRAIDERNRSAAKALRAYYQLAEAEGKYDLLAQSLDKLDKSIEQNRELQKQGIATRNGGTLEAQRLASVSSRTELNTAIAQLNGQLRVLLHLDDTDLTPIWPAADLTVEKDEFDVDEAIAEGIALRPDLAALRLMRDSVNSETLPVIQQSMSIMGATVGTGAISSHHLNLAAKREIEDQICLRRRQLFQLYSDAERAATEEIRQAALAVNASLRAISLTNARMARLARNNEDRRRLRDTGDATHAEIAKGELEILTARGDLLHRVIEWKLAIVKLREAQGQLAADCGYVAACCKCR